MHIAILGLLAISSGAAAAQQGATPPPSCAASEYHQFDFWAGRWDVYDPAGKLIAHSLIEPVYGCGIRENWMPIGKAGGGSLSIYVPAARHWEQFWIDSSGSRAYFTGGWNGSAMVITGEWGGPLVRMTYRKNGDGSVVQSGEQSTDKGKSWTPTFAFTYRPAAAGAH
jgi:hypothetical protein